MTLGSVYDVVNQASALFLKDWSLGIVEIQENKHIRAIADHSTYPLGLSALLVFSRFKLAKKCQQCLLLMESFSNILFSG